MTWTTLILALQAIHRNLLRSGLTVLGIVIGVAAVIVMVTIGNGATLQVTQQISSLGSNLLLVQPGRRMGPGQAIGAGPFTMADAAAIRREIPAAAAVAPTSSQTLTAIYGNENWTTTVTGADDAYLTARKWRMARGRPFTDSELRSGAAVCAIGATVRTKLFGAQDPIGASMRLQKLACTVVGVLEPKGQAAMGQDQDDVVLVPLRTFQRRIAGNTDVRTILVSVREGASTERVVADIETLLRERRHVAPGADDNFTVLDMKEITRALTGTTRVLTALLGAVAAVSLLVGGIGIMNIMLVSVTERTREIGIRLAIGAMERDVLLQFLVEAVVLSSLGGVLGIVLAMGASLVLAGVLQVPFVFNAGIVLIAFAFAAAVGVVFGYFPARRAAHLNPIDALHYE
ncbi:MAG TPA: ABC transporter permease [Steroidobacteraceae bacterium]|nr:ABC transporter permease [Steroidobacteraceae bacterium]